jgi:ferredoxin-type protein NapH
MIAHIKSIRRAGQALAATLLLVIPALGIWGVQTLRVWDPAQLENRYGALAAHVTGWLNQALGDPPEWAVGATTGGTWSISLGPMELADPIALGTILMGGALPPLTFGIGALLVLAFQMATGRAFCGYLCPYGVLARLVSRVRQPLARWGLVHDLRPPSWTRVAILVGVLVAPVAGVSIVGIALPYLLIARIPHAAVFGGLAGWSVLISAFLLSDLLLWENGVCRHLCPSGWMQGLVGRWRVLRLHAEPTLGCEKGCTECLDDCWLGLDPRKAKRLQDCDSCGRCVTGCPTLRLGVRLEAPPKRRKRATAATATAVGLIALAPLWASPADAAPPEVISGTRSFATPFFPSGDPDYHADVTFFESEVEGRALAVGVAVVSQDEVGLRVYLEETPGEPYTGPLRFTVTTADGAVQVTLEEPKEPRSSPRRTLYETRLRMELPASVAFDSGPMAGHTVEMAPALPTPPRVLFAPAAVVGLWIFGFAVRRKRDED